MAQARTLTVRHNDILKLEGLAQALAELPPVDRPKTEAVAYIAQQLGLKSHHVVQEWVRLTRPASRRSDTAAAFYSVYERIADLLSEQLEARVWDMAKPGQRDAFRAATWLLPRVNPERFDPSLRENDKPEEDVFSTAGVSQQVFDSLSDETRERIAELRQIMYDAMDEYETLIKTAQGEVLARELAQRQETAAAETESNAPRRGRSP